MRPPDRFSSKSFDNAINIPLKLLRNDCWRLSNKRLYIVCTDDVGTSRADTLLMHQHGLEAVSLGHGMNEGKVQASPADSVVPFPGGGSPSAEPEQTHQGEASDAELVTAAKRREIELKAEDIESTEPIPRDLYDDTFVGASLADLIDQMHERRTQNFDSPEPTDTAEAPGKASHLEQFVETVEKMATQGAPPDDAVTASLRADDGLTALMEAFEQGLRAYVERRRAAVRDEVHAEVDTSVAQIKQLAVAQIHQQIESFQRQYCEQLGDKEQLVKNQYAQLVAVAHKITRQKAEIKKASQDLQSTLEATAQLQREIDAVRTTITDGIGNFDSLESELSGTR